MKNNTSDKPLITVLTVVLNGVDFLEETIQNIANQTYENIEYIIIDGGSTDGTLDVIKKYESLVAQWISEPDEGLYDAMNKGIDLASADWINIMNAGDKFYSNKTISEIFDGQLHNSDIIYGDMQLDREGVLQTKKAHNLDILWKKVAFCSQSAFISTQYFKQHKFNLQFSIAADFDFFYSAYFYHNAIFEYSDTIIAIFLHGGVSNTPGGARKQNFQVINSYPGLHIKFNLYYLASLLPKLIEEKVKTKIRSIK
ncbi:glycosyltransferase family 2 protein [Bathymodiolus septemdierum thioautotrophic gill symbiont]|uniref:Glycosyl transferase family 2 n=1 Tax=endosymbiont of Bathymodiolus septemdierum str. Myojin knoll TaxID=1303921 RepID=A0A0P0UR38_9GAMM|nr:glycosyltransferase family 2 protein [Bathymodiolus septemdierum thioautotrophic gill symbiont]BAS67676.1 glycosyl transferase family 2 [endosymbiont of Bathymodiolus septemdierum str. Myojin knoll]